MPKKQPEQATAADEAAAHRAVRKASAASAAQGDAARPGPEVELREMTLEDLPLVFGLGERLFTADRWPTLYRTWDEYELVELFASDGDYALVAEADGQVAGFVLGTLIEKRRSAWKYGYLIWIGVDPARGGQGIGGKLVRRLTDLFITRGARMMLVDTEADNEAAVAFFERLGFGNHQPHVYMMKNLTSDPTYRRRRDQLQRRRGARRAKDVKDVKDRERGDG